MGLLFECSFLVLGSASHRVTQNLSHSVFGKDGRGREPVFVTEVSAVDVFLSRQVEIWPIGRSDADDSGRAHAFGDEVRFKTDLDATAA